MTFTSELFRTPGKGGWTFVTVPSEAAPQVAGPWGRTPCIATVDGRAWATSVWKGKDGTWPLAVPKRIRGDKEHGDLVEVSLSQDPERAV